MQILARLKNALRSQGVTGTLYKIRALVADYWFDLVRGTDTCALRELSRLTVEGENKSHGFRYQPTRVLPLRTLFRALAPRLPTGSALLDYGSGKGRVLLVAAEFPFAAVRGVEFAPELCAIAEANRTAFARRFPAAPRMEIIAADATSYLVRPDETVFFFGNPFGEVVMREVLARIESSLQDHPRRIFIAYYNPNFASIFERAGWLHRLESIVVPAYDFRIFSNQPE